MPPDLTRFVPWASDEWRYATFKQLLSLNLTGTDVTSAAEVVRRTLADTGFTLESQLRVKVGGPLSEGPGVASVFLYERSAELNMRAAARDVLMPDGSAILLVFLVMFGLVTLLWFASGRFLTSDPWIWTWLAGMPLGGLGLWFASRTRRFVRTVGIRADFQPLEDAGTGKNTRGVKLTLGASEIQSKLTYPKPLYQARRVLVGSEPSTAVDSVIARLRTSTSAPS